MSIALQFCYDDYRSFMNLIYQIDEAFVRRSRDKVVTNGNENSVL